MAMDGAHYAHMMLELKLQVFQVNSLLRHVIGYMS